MKIGGQLTWQDYLQAQRLHMRQNNLLRIILYAVLGLIALGLLAYIALVLAYHERADALLGLWPLLVFAGLYLLYIYVFIPWRVRRLFDQHREMAAPIEQEITAEGVTSTSQVGVANRPWSYFRKWKEDKDLFMLYLTDIQFLMLPKRFFTAEQMETLRGYLAQNKLADASRSYRSCLLPLAIYLLLLLLVGLVFFLNFRTPYP